MVNLLVFLMPLSIRKSAVPWLSKLMHCFAIRHGLLFCPDLVRILLVANEFFVSSGISMVLLSAIKLVLWLRISISVVALIILTSSILLSNQLLFALSWVLLFLVLGHFVNWMWMHECIQEDVYMAQPPSFVDHACPHYVCHLQKSLYGS